MRRTLMTAVAAAALATASLGACAQTETMDGAQADAQSRTTAQTQMDTQAQSSAYGQTQAQTQTHTPSNTTGQHGSAQTQSAAQTSFTDAQLRAFVAASAEIDPINRQLQANPGGDQTAAVQQIRDVLARHSLDADTYNAIARQASQDQALAARIAAMQTASGGDGGSAPTP